MTKDAFLTKEMRPIVVDHDILLDCARESAKVATIAIVTPNAPIQVTEDSDIFSTKLPPIPASAAIASYITD